MSCEKVSSKAHHETISQVCQVMGKLQLMTPAYLIFEQPCISVCCLYFCRASTNFANMGNDFSSILRSTHMDSPKLARVPSDGASALQMISHLLSIDDFRHITNVPAAAGKNLPMPGAGLPAVGSHRTPTAGTDQHRPQGSSNSSDAFESHTFSGGFGVGMTPAMGRFVR